MPHHGNDGHLRHLPERGLRLITPMDWTPFVICEDGLEFGRYIASAEERGRKAGLMILEALGSIDPKTAAVFQIIVDDEVLHIALAQRYCGFVR